MLGKNLQKEICEVKDEVTNSEFILKAKNQRIKELRKQLNNMNSTYEKLNSRNSQSRSSLNNANYITNFSEAMNNTMVFNRMDLDKDSSIDFNFLKGLNYNTNLKPNIKDCNLSCISESSNLNTPTAAAAAAKEPETPKSANKLRKTASIDKELNFKEVMEESEKCVKLKEEIEAGIKELREIIKQKQEQMDNYLFDADKCEEQYKKLEEEYGFIRVENLKMDKKYQKMVRFLENHEIFIKNFESEMGLIKNRIDLSKAIYDNLQKDFILKLYFVRFSNSMVRSLFNIINIRRLHIEMLKIFSERDMKNYSNHFKKLDETETKIVKEYHDFYNFVKKEEHKFH